MTDDQFTGLIVTGAIVGSVSWGYRAVKNSRWLNRRYPWAAEHFAFLWVFVGWPMLMGLGFLIAFTAERIFGP